MKDTIRTANTIVLSSKTVIWKKCSITIRYFRSNYQQT